jgi:hypothetical protein
MSEMIGEEIDDIFKETTTPSFEADIKYTFAEAEDKCKKLKAYSKKFWAENNYNIWNCQHYDQIRRNNPEAPSDGYGIRFGFSSVYREEATGCVRLANPCVLAGDGRAHHKDGTLYELDDGTLNSQSFVVIELDYIYW